MLTRRGGRDAAGHSRKEGPGKRRQVTCACQLQAAAAEGAPEHLRIRSVHPAAEDPCTPAYMAQWGSNGPDPSRSPISIQKVLHTIIVDPICPSRAYEDASKPRQHLQTVNWPLPAGRRSTPGTLHHQQGTTTAATAARTRQMLGSPRVCNGAAACKASQAESGCRRRGR